MVQLLGPDQKDAVSLVHRQFVHHPSEGAAVAVEDAPAAASERNTDIAERVRTLRLEKEDLIKTPRHRWRGALLVLLLVGLGSSAVYGYTQGWRLPQLRAAPELETLPAARERALEILLDTTGYVAARHIVKVNPRVPGTVMELAIEEGQRVRKGDVLARLDDGQYRADLDQARAALSAAQAALAEAKLGARDEEIARARALLAQAEAQRELARSQLRRAQKLKNTISPAELERSQALAREAEAAVTQAAEGLKLLQRGPRPERLAALAAEVDRAKALVAKAQYFFDGTQIRAPSDGTVLQKSVELGETVRAEALAGNNFCTLANLDQLQVEIDVQERDLASLRVGQPCLVLPEAYPDREYQGRVEWMSPIYNRQRGVRRVKIEITKPDELLAPDMNCRVQVLEKAPAAEADKVVRLPVEAVRNEGDKRFVWLLNDGVARRRDVTVGTASQGKIEIRAGLGDGETVLLPESQPLIDGQPVRVRAKGSTGKVSRFKSRGRTTS
jgi:HlyD family secretion protein